MFAENSRYYLIKNQAQPYCNSDKVVPKMSETLGELIQRRMKDLDIRTNAKLAELTGLSGAYIGDLINDRGKTKRGYYQPEYETVEVLARVLKVSFIEILGGTGQIPDDELKVVLPALKKQNPIDLSGVDFRIFSKEEVEEIVRFIQLIARLKTGNGLPDDIQPRMANFEPETQELPPRPKENGKEFKDKNS